MMRALLVFLALMSWVWPASSTTSGAREIRVATLKVSSDAVRGEAQALADLNDALAREICRRATVRCVLQPLPFADIISGVEAGRFQLAVANVLDAPERRERVLFSQPLWRSSSRLVGTPGAIERYSGHGDIALDTLRHARIAVVRGSQQHRHVASVAGNQALQVIEAASTGELLPMLRSGQADFSLMPIRNAFFLMRREVPGSFAFAGQPLIDHGLGGTVHAILPKSEAPLRQEVDAALDAMKKDGTFQRILRLYMPFLAD